MTMSASEVAATDRQPRFAAIRTQVVGREDELESILAAVATGRDLVLEGPPGTSKTTLLRAITQSWDIPLIFVEGNAELTPGRLLGHHDPARVLREGFSPDTFVPGPLVQAMQEGGFLHFEELNRAPEDALNALLTAVADREVTIPRVGTIRAQETFRVVASMNPYDNVGTTRLSVSLRDRFCRLAVDYQHEGAEQDIVAMRAAVTRDEPLAARRLEDAVAVVRMTRSHEFVRQGSSVRGAIDLYLLAAQFNQVRGITAPDDTRYAPTFFKAMLLALSGRLLLDESAGVDSDSVLREIWEEYFLLRSAKPG
jgi:MoxR-like ATPase